MKDQGSGQALEGFCQVAFGFGPECPGYGQCSVVHRLGIGVIAQIQINAPNHVPHLQLDLRGVGQIRRHSGGGLGQNVLHDHGVAAQCDRRANALKGIVQKLGHLPAFGSLDPRFFAVGFCFAAQENLRPFSSGRPQSLPGANYCGGQQKRQQYGRPGEPCFMAPNELARAVKRARCCRSYGLVMQMLFNIQGQCIGGLVTPRAVLLQAFHDDPVQIPMQQASQRVWLRPAILRDLGLFLPKRAQARGRLERLLFANHPPDFIQAGPTQNLGIKRSYSGQ